MGCAASRSGGFALSLPGATPTLDGLHLPEQDCAKKAQLPQSRALGTEKQPSFHDRYILRKKLGCGAFASVHSACRADNRGSEELAVKITDLRAQRSKGAFGRFVDTRRCQEIWNEIDMLQTIQGSPNTVGFFDAFMEGGISYVVMEKCDSPLLHVLDQMPFVNESSLWGILRDMLQGIAAIHKVRVVHRDVKPDNFLCAGQPPTVKLCDFGFASVVASDSVEDGLRGVFGTPPFMAPEILKKAHYSMPVDMWSFGVVVYAFLFGEFPYMPPEHTGAAMKVAIKEGVPAPSFRLAKSLLRHSGSGLSGSAAAGAPSPAAMSLARMLLQRQAEQRASARTALTTDFFTSPRHTSGRPEDVLRPQLRSAKRIGVFDVGCGLGYADTDVDRRLATLQAQQHGAAPTLLQQARLKDLRSKVDRKQPTPRAEAGKLRKSSLDEDLESCASTYASGESP